MFSDSFISANIKNNLKNNNNNTFSNEKHFEKQPLLDFQIP